jgi:hypothetical protein
VWYWLSCTKLTIAVRTGPDGRLLEAPPIAHWALGRNLVAVEHWMRQIGGFRRVDLDPGLDRSADELGQGDPTD